MQIKNKIAVIGGAGKSGEFVTRALLNQYLPVRMLLRHPENNFIDSPLKEIVAGDARDSLALIELLRGCDALISTLGQPKGENISVFSAAGRNIIQAMNHHGMKRYIVLTGLTVDVPGDKKGIYAAGGTQWMKTNYPVTTADKQLEWELLQASDLDWTMVRVPLIDLSEKKPDIRISLTDCPGEKISAASLADFLVNQLQDRTYIRQASFIANKSETT
jgi:putative NADH-flavin reductase